MVARVSQSIIGVDLNADIVYAAISASTPEIPAFPHKVGTQVEATDGSIWIFAKATAAITQYDTVGIDKDGNATSVAGGASAVNLNRGTAFRQGSTMAANEAGWFMKHGAPLIRVGDSCAANVQLYTTATAGVLDDAVSSGSQFPIRGVFLVSTAGTGGAGSIVSGVQAIANFPHSAPATVT